MRGSACLLLLAQITFSARTEMVVLPVTVTDARGHSVAGLTAADFRVFDQDKLQEIALFRSGEIPITLGLVVDHSQSMRSKLPAVNASATAFARAGHRDDELFVVAFDDHPWLMPFASGRAFSSDPVELEAALKAEVPGGPTALYDAVAEALRQLPHGKAERKALIVVTDGGDNASKISYRNVRDLARESQAVIYGIGLLGALDQDEDPDKLKQLCRDSGGVAYFPQTAASVWEAFTEIANDLRSQYTIGFVPGIDATKRIYHPLRVTVPAGAKMQVRTRAGYIIEAGR